MSTHTRAGSKSKHKLRHPGARGKYHAEDKRQADARRGIFVVLPAAAKDNRPSLESRGMRSSERIHRGGWITECQGEEEFGNYIEHEAGERNWAYCERSKRGKIVTERILTPTAVEILVVPFAPWVTAFIEAKLAAGEDANTLALKIWALFCTYAKVLLVGDHERYFLGEALHMDTANAHGDLVLSRQEDGMRVGRAGLALGGPWLVGTDRQLRAGATISPKKQKHFDQDIQKHFRRHGRNSRPFDILLARALDRAADEVIGPELVRYRTAYAASVPAREQRAIDTKLARLEAAKAALMNELTAQEPSTGYGPY